MIVTRSACDHCGVTGVPESTEDPYVPPYGWYRVHLDIIGLGPFVDVETCSLNCVKPALEEAIKASQYE